jgi:hypothetical protein
LLGWRVWIKLESWKSVSSDCCLLPGRGTWVGLFAHPEVPNEYGMAECNREPSTQRSQGH